MPKIKGAVARNLVPRPRALFFKKKIITGFKKGGF